MARHKTPMLPPADKRYLHGSSVYSPMTQAPVAEQRFVEPARPIIGIDGTELDQGAEF
jgi:hypothetical protein